MEEDDEDDIYAPDDATKPGQVARATHNTANNPPANKDQDEEEGEEVEEDESDSVSANSSLAQAVLLT